MEAAAAARDIVPRMPDPDEKTEAEKKKEANYFIARLGLGQPWYERVRPFWVESMKTSQIRAAADKKRKELQASNKSQKRRGGTAGTSSADEAAAAAAAVAARNESKEEGRSGGGGGAAAATEERAQGGRKDWHNVFDASSDNKRNLQFIGPVMAVKSSLLKLGNDDKTAPEWLEHKYRAKHLHEAKIQVAWHLSKQIYEENVQEGEKLWPHVERFRDILEGIETANYSRTCFNKSCKYVDRVPAEAKTQRDLDAFQKKKGKLDHLQSMLQDGAITSDAFKKQKAAAELEFEMAVSKKMSLTDLTDAFIEQYGVPVILDAANPVSGRPPLKWLKTVKKLFKEKSETEVAMSSLATKNSYEDKRIATVCRVQQVEWDPPMVIPMRQDPDAARITWLGFGLPALALAAPICEVATVLCDTTQHSFRIEVRCIGFVLYKQNGARLVNPVRSLAITIPKFEGEGAEKWLPAPLFRAKQNGHEEIDSMSKEDLDNLVDEALARHKRDAEHHAEEVVYVPREWKDGKAGSAAAGPTTAAAAAAAGGDEGGGKEGNKRARKEQ